MILKTYHTIDLEEYKTFRNHFHRTYGSHYIDLPNGRILLAAAFSNEWAEEFFDVTSKTKLSLPHPVFQANAVIGKQHEDELKHLFNGDASNKTVRNVAQRAALIHPMMKLSVF